MLYLLNLVLPNLCMHNVNKNEISNSGILVLIAFLFCLMGGVLKPETTINEKEFIK